MLGSTIPLPSTRYEKQRAHMRDATINVVQEIFGKPDGAINGSAAVWRWHVRHNLDVIVQRDTSGEEGRVWVPANNAITLPGFAECHPDGISHTGEYGHQGCPSLAQDRPAWCLAITEKGQLGQLARFLQVLKADEGKGLAKTNSSQPVAEAVGTFFKIVSFGKYVPGPPGAALGIIGDVGEKAVDWIDKRSQKQRVERLEQQMDAVVRRLGVIERPPPTEEQVNLFLEVLKRAIEDDERQKQPIYAAMMTWILDKSPHATEVRLLSDAVRQLSYLEIWQFVEIMHRNTSYRIRDIRPGELKQDIPWFDIKLMYNRLVAFGLSEDAAVRDRGSPTYLGRLLKDFCDPNQELPIGLSKS